MSRKRKILRLAPILFLLLPTMASAQRRGAPEGPEADFLRGAAEYYNVAPQEVFVLSRWGMAPAEIPVVLFLAGRAGVSPDVVVAQRQRGRDWLEISRGFGVHSGDFYVRFQGSPGFLADAYGRFEETRPAGWSRVQLSDRDVIGLVNVRFMSRFLEVPPRDVVVALGEGMEVVAGYRTLAARRIRGT